MKADRVGSGWVLLGIVLLSAGMAQGGDPEITGTLKDFVIPTTGDSPTAKAEQDHLSETLALVKPKSKGKEQVSRTKYGGYVLSGNLFKTGSCFALFEAESENCSVGLAERVDGKWLIRGLWNMPLAWLPKGMKWDGSDGNPSCCVEPYHQPFVLRDLNGDGVPEVIVAGEVDKYYKSTYLLKYSLSTRGLDLLKWTINQPELAGKYVKLYDKSPRRAIWEEWSFFEWKEGVLVERASWHSEVPYNNIDPPFYEVRVMREGKTEKFRATSGDEDGIYQVLKDDKPFANLVIQWKPGKSDPNENLDSAWLFEKLTELPREIFPESHGPENNDKSKPDRLEEVATIEVSGTEEGKRRFSANK